MNSIKVNSESLKYRTLSSKVYSNTDEYIFIRTIDTI